jgi:hypothetical protein
LKALAALQHVRTKSQSGALTVQIACLSKLIIASRNDEELSNVIDMHTALTKLAAADAHPQDRGALKGSKQFGTVPSRKVHYHN